MAQESHCGFKPQDYQSICQDAWKLYPHIFAKRASKGKWVPYKHLRYISSVIGPKILEGNGRFIITTGPRHGKSELISNWLPTWYLHNFPKKKIILSSYSLELASKWGAQVKENLTTIPEIAIPLKVDTKSKRNFLTTAGGGMISAGVGGPITGVGGDCFTGETPVQTNQGPMTIEYLTKIVDKPLILSYNHNSNEYEYKRIEACRVKKVREIFEVSFNSGRSFKTTGAHPVFTRDKGYVKAQELIQGQYVIRAKEVSALQEAHLQKKWPNVQNMPRSRTIEIFCDSMRVMPKEKDSSEMRNSKSVKRKKNKRWQAILLKELRAVNLQSTQKQEMQSVQNTSFQKRREALQQMLSNNKKSYFQDKMCLLQQKDNTSQIRNGKITSEEKSKRRETVLFNLVCESDIQSICEPFMRNVPKTYWDKEQTFLQFGMQGTKPIKTKNIKTVQNVQNHIQGQKQFATALFQKMCGRNTIVFYDWKYSMGRSRALTGPVYERISENKIAYTGSRQEQMCGLSKEEATSKTSYSSYRRSEIKQLPYKSNSIVRRVPYNSPQIETDSVSMVKRLCKEEHTVYDIQVEGNHNFFANEILVHNCIIIDDYLKNYQEAMSELIRERHKDWYRSVIRTRLEPNASICIMATRWHESDLIGWLIAEDIERLKEDPNHIPFTVINFPTICEEEGDPLSRKIGEPLCPERFDLPALLSIKKDVGDLVWSALYQQHPTSLEGNIILKEWIRYYDILPTAFDEEIITADLSFKEGTTTDFTVVQKWSRKGSDMFLIDQIRGRMGFPDQIAAIRLMNQRHPNAFLKIIEEAANGAAVIEMLKHEIMGLVPVKPQTSKEARLAAISPMFEAGNVHFPNPKHSEWVNGVVSEILSCPNGKHDDQMDAAVYAITHMSKVSSSVQRLESLGRW